MRRFGLLVIILTGCVGKRIQHETHQPKLDCIALRQAVIGEINDPLIAHLAAVEWSYPDDWKALDQVQASIGDSSLSADDLFLLAQIKIILANHPDTSFLKKPGMVKQGLNELDQVIKKFPNNCLFRLKRLEFQIFLPSVLRQQRVIQDDFLYFSQMKITDHLCHDLIQDLSNIWNHGSLPQQKIRDDDPRFARYRSYKRRQYRALLENR